MSSVKTRGGTPLSQHPAPSRFYIKAAQCSNSIFLSDQQSLQQQQRHDTGSKVLSPPTILAVAGWIHFSQSPESRLEGRGEGYLSLTLPGAAGEGFKQKIIDIIDLSRLGGVVWCGVVRWGYSRWGGVCSVAVAGAGRPVQLYSYNRFVCWSFPLSHHPQLSLLIDSPRLAFTINPSNQ